MEGNTTSGYGLSPGISWRASVIVPVLNEGPAINELIRHVRDVSRGAEVEVIVADGHPEATTLAVLTEPDVVHVHAPLGRAVQMNAGARLATGEMLIFLHADTRLPPGAVHKAHEALAQGAVAGAFDLAIDSDRLWFRMLARVASKRSRLERIPYGDQVHFFSAALFRELGGYAEIPIMEDVEMFRRIRRAGKPIRILGDRAVTSARRWEKEGIFRRTLMNWGLRFRYACGADPAELVKQYRPHTTEPTERT